MNVFYGKRHDGRPWHSVIIRGGGYGEPLERDPGLVGEDVVDGYPSVEAARKYYGVVIDPVTGRPDVAATDKVRKAIRAGSR